MYVCMYVCVYARVYVHVHAIVCMCVCVCVCVFAHSRVHTCMFWFQLRDCKQEGVLVLNLNKIAIASVKDVSA